MTQHSLKNSYRKVIFPQIFAKIETTRAILHLFVCFLFACCFDMVYCCCVNMVVLVVSLGGVMGPLVH